MKHSESIAKLAAALVAAQAELRAVGMDAVNPHFKARYASLDNIIETIRPTLARHSLAVVQGATLPESNAEGKVTGFTVETMLIHQSGEWLLSGVIMPIAKADPQGAGAAITYGRRYGISALLSLATDEDDDGNRASQQRSGGGRTGGPSSGGTAEAGHKPARETGASATTQPVPRGKSAIPTEEQAEAAMQVVMPMGKHKGQAIGDIDTESLRTAVQWIKDHSMAKKYAEVVDAISKVLIMRALDLESAA